jgi:hypothetical protein
MKNSLLITGLIMLLVLARVNGQDNALEGTVTFITSQNVYVRFSSTESLNTGDTLYLKNDSLMVPALVISSKSSTSCVCTPLADIRLNISDKLFSQADKAGPDQLPVIPTWQPVLQESPIPDSASTAAPIGTKKPEQDISGRASISSYLNFSNTPGGNTQRMRYTLSLNAKNIAGTRLSGEGYVSFIHNSGRWDEIQENVLNGLKIYNLSLNYAFSENTRLVAGRKINPKLSGMGAIDGFQFETRLRSFTIGAVAGFRPDYSDYGFNGNLFQAGAFVSHDYTGPNGNMQSTLAFIDQENGWNTDRRFLYFQHFNTILKNLYLFTSVEFDLYRYIDDQKSTTFDPTNFYILLRYKVIKPLTLSLSYSARNNIIYYETYKSMVDRMLESSTLQGVTFQAQVRPVPKLSVGAKAGYRSRKEDPRPSWNADGYITYSQVPFLKVSATASFTYTESSYISGNIFSAGISRDILPGKVYCGINYRYVDYSFYTNESSLAQNMAEVNLNWNIWKKLLMSLYYEGTFERQNQFNRVYINVTQRF